MHPTLGVLVGAGILLLFSRFGRDENELQLCYVTVIMTPSVLPTYTCCDITSVHTSYDLLPPFPSFIPSLSLKLPGEESKRAGKLCMVTASAKIDPTTVVMM